MPLVEPGGAGHQLDGGDAEAGEVGDRRRMGKAGVCPRGGGDLRMGHGEAAHVQLVDDLMIPIERTRRISGHYGSADDGLRHQGGRVVGARAAAVEQGLVQPEGSVERGGPRVDQQFVAVEAVTAGRIPGTPGPQTIACASWNVGDEAVKHRSGAARQKQPFGFIVRGVEQAECDAISRRRGENRR